MSIDNGEGRPLPPDLSGLPADQQADLLRLAADRAAALGRRALPEVVGLTDREVARLVFAAYYARLRGDLDPRADSVSNTLLATWLAQQDQLPS